MFSSLRSRLWLSYGLLIVTALSIVAMIVFLSLLRNPLMWRQVGERLRLVQTDLTQRGAGPLPEAAQKAARTFDVRVLQYSADRQLIFDTGSGSQPALVFPRRKLVVRNIPLLKDERGGTWLYSLAQLSDGSYLIVATPRPSISILAVFADDFLPLIVQSGCVALILSLFLAFIFSRWIADPLQAVITAARGVPQAPAKPIEEHGPHEVQELTRAFNSMIGRVQSSQRSQREFVANVSHELKTPLTSIQGFSQALLDGTAESAQARTQAAQVIYDESTRMHRMVLDLLDLAKLDAGTADITMSPVNMSALLKAVVEKFSPQSQSAHVAIDLEVASDLPAIVADGDRLAQVFTNLVDNALKFTPAGGSVIIAAARMADELHCSVSDTGGGISNEAQAHIFDRFYQADAARRGGHKHGAGLGLAIVREIVQAHGGRITVRSRLGEGTTFDVFLPLSQNTKSTVLRKK